MNIFETLEAGTARLVKTGRKIVDSTSGEPELRERLEKEINVLFDAADQTRMTRFYPLIENKDPGFSGWREAYRQRSESITDRIRELMDLPKDSTDPYQARAEMLYNEILQLEKWEKHDVIPPTRGIVPEEDAEEMGNLARGEEKAIERERL